VIRVRPDRWFRPRISNPDATGPARETAGRASARVAVFEHETGPGCAIAAIHCIPQSAPNASAVGARSFFVPPAPETDGAYGYANSDDPPGSGQRLCLP
jgi:hypothetical protein